MSGSLLAAVGTTSSRERDQATSLRRKPQTEGAKLGHGQGAPLQIGPRLLASGQLCLEPSRSPLERIAQGQDLGLPTLLVGVMLLRWKLQPHLFGQHTHCLQKGQSLMGHQKTDGRAVGATTEAVVETPLPIHGKGWGFFLMEWAQPREILALTAQGYTSADHIGYIDALQQIPQPRLRQATSHDAPGSINPALLQGRRQLPRRPSVRCMRLA